MEIVRLNVLGNPNIGVYVFVNDSIALIPPGLSKDEKDILIEILSVELIESKIADTIINGVLIAGNNNGIVLPRIVLDTELNYLKKELSKFDINLYVSGSRNTALGNLFLCNNKACIVGSEMEKEEINKVSNTLGVEIIVKDLLELTIPGSLAVVTDKGGVTHPDLSDEDISYLNKVFNVRFKRATVNSGVPFIKSGLIANNHGALVGGFTTGPEILRIKKGLEG